MLSEESSLEEKLGPAVLDWAAPYLQGNAVKAAMPLAGGTSTQMWQLWGEDGYSLILRLYDNQVWRDEEPDLVRHEAASLQIASEGGSIPAPFCAAFDERPLYGQGVSAPALLMTVVPGKPDLSPDNLEFRLRQMAECAAAVHCLPAPDFPWHYFPYQNLEMFPIPTWPKDPGAMSAAKEMLLTWKRPQGDAFLHRDFHPGNILFADGQLTGLVDWPSSCLGPWQVDVGHCRTDLVQLYGLEAADAFTSYYLQASGRESYDPRWDLHCLFDVFFGTPTADPGYLALGAENLTDAKAADSLEELLAAALKRSVLDF